MALLASLHDHRRSAERQELDASATLRVDGRPLDALVANISASGCLFVCDELLGVGDTVTIGITGIGRHGARIVRALDSRFGAVFDTPLTKADLDAAAAMPGETVVLFPLPLVAVPSGDESAETHRLSFGTRLMIVAGLTAATWGALVPVLHVTVPRLAHPHR